jgi:hypothetical protein
MDRYPWDTKIAGYAHPVHPSPPSSHFADLNIIGQDFFNLHNFRTWPSVEDRTVAYYFGKNWEDPKPKL